MLHFSRRLFQTLFLIHSSFLPSFQACLNIYESLCDKESSRRRHIGSLTKFMVGKIRRSLKEEVSKLTKYYINLLIYKIVYNLIKYNN